MPPICCYCDRRFGPDEGGLVSFKKGPADREWDERAREPGFVGHPPYMQWFCGEHHEAAATHEHLTLPEAMAQLRERFGAC